MELDNIPYQVGALSYHLETEATSGHYCTAMWIYNDDNDHEPGEPVKFTAPPFQPWGRRMYVSYMAQMHNSWRRGSVLEVGGRISNLRQHHTMTARFRMTGNINGFLPLSWPLQQAKCIMSGTLYGLATSAKLMIEQPGRHCGPSLYSRMVQPQDKVQNCELPQAGARVVLDLTHADAVVRMARVCPG